MDIRTYPENSTLSSAGSSRTGRNLADEAAKIASARASAAAGLLIEHTEIDAWIDSIGSKNELPPPEPAA